MAVNDCIAVIMQTFLLLFRQWVALPGVNGLTILIRRQSNTGMTVLQILLGIVVCD